MIDYKEFQCELQALFEKYDLHGIMVIPHHIMAEYLTTCRRALETALIQIEAENETHLRRRSKEEIRKIYGDDVFGRASIWDKNQPGQKEE